MIDAAAIKIDANRAASEPARAVTHHDLISVYGMIAALASVVGQQTARIAELEARPKAGRPAGVKNFR